VEELVNFVREKFGYITLKKVLGEPNIIVENLKKMKEVEAEQIPKIYDIQFVGLTKSYVRVNGSIKIPPHSWDFSILVLPTRFQMKPAKFIEERRAKPEENALALDAWNLIRVAFEDLRRPNAQYLALAKGFITATRRVSAEPELDPR
jgi:hypothetical protein